MIKLGGTWSGVSVTGVVLGQMRRLGVVAIISRDFFMESLCGNTCTEDAVFFSSFGFSFNIDFLGVCTGKGLGVDLNGLRSSGISIGCEQFDLLRLA